MVESENALIENIKKKGENSYYYAHAPRNIENLEEAKVFEGEGLVTGGPPKLIKRHDSTNDFVPISNIKNYSWADSDDKVTIYVPFENNIEENQVACEIDINGLDMRYVISDIEIKRLILKRLYKAIDPANSSYKIRKNKVVITLKKEINGSWYKLNSEAN